MRPGSVDSAQLLRRIKAKSRRAFFQHAPKPVIVQARKIVSRQRSRSKARAEAGGFPAVTTNSPLHAPVKQPHFPFRVGYIMDEFSLSAWGPEFNLVPVTPGATEEELSDLDFFFVESAWNGNDGQWQYQLTGPNSPSAELTRVVDACKKIGVPTFFWNKEDPPHYDDFLNTARLFDVVATTDSNLLPQYAAALGHENVMVLPFAAQPAVHNPARNGVEEPVGDVAFAGTYFREKYPERRKQMDLLLGAAHNAAESYGLKFTIFSRHAGGEKKYQFPRRWSKHVAGSLPYAQMLGAYRSFKTFLNVNSVTESPSMCARRIFEIVASGTPVISTESAALRNFFTPEEVPSASTEEEAELVIRALTNSDQLRRRTVHRAQRRIWEEHSYRHRAESVLHALGFEHDERTTPKVSVICSTNRDSELDHLLEQVAHQTYPEIELLVEGHGIDIAADFANRARRAGIDDVTVLSADGSTSLGNCLNLMIAHASGDIIAKFDDDDYYLPNYLRDQVNTLCISNADLVGKASLYFYLPSIDSVVRRWPRREHTWHRFVSGSTLVGWKEVFDETPFANRTKGEDSDLLVELESKGRRVYSSDSFNYLCVRGNSEHTWNISEAEILANSVVETHGLNIAHVEV